MSKSFLVMRSGNTTKLENFVETKHTATTTTNNRHFRMETVIFPLSPSISFDMREFGNHFQTRQYRTLHDSDRRLTRSHHSRNRVSRRTLDTQMGKPHEIRLIAFASEIICTHWLLFKSRSISSPSPYNRSEIFRVNLSMRCLLGCLVGLVLNHMILAYSFWKGIVYQMNLSCTGYNYLGEEKNHPIHSLCFVCVSAKHILELSN